MNNTPLIISGLILIALLSISYDIIRLTGVEKHLRLIDLARCLEFNTDDEIKARTYDFLAEFFVNGFPAGYSMVYRQLSSNYESPATTEKAAISALILALQHTDLSQENRNATVSLLIKYLGKHHLSMNSALAWQKLDRQHEIFSLDTRHADLFRKYLRQVWAIEVKSEVSERKSLTENAQKFLQHFPEFHDETKQLLIKPEGPEKKWEFKLIAGRTGENEDDFELREVTDQ